MPVKELPLRTMWWAIFLIVSEVILFIVSVVAGFSHHYKLAYFCLLYAIWAEVKERRLAKKWGRSW